jgi:hypothetical protein
MYRVWLDPEDGLIVNTDLPTETYSNLATREDDNRILCGYLAVTSSNTMTSFQNVASFWNEPERVWWADVPHDHNWRDNSYAAVAVLSISGLVVPQDRIQAHVSLSGGMQAIGAAFSPPTYPPYTIQCTTPWQPPVGSSTCRRRWPVGGGGIAEFNATSVVSSSVTSNPFELEEDLYASGEWTMAFTATVDYEAYADVRLAESSEGRVTVTRRQK